MPKMTRLCEDEKSVSLPPWLLPYLKQCDYTTFIIVQRQKKRKSQRARAMCSIKAKHLHYHPSRFNNKQLLVTIHIKYTTCSIDITGVTITTTPLSPNYAQPAAEAPHPYQSQKEGVQPQAKHVSPAGRVWTLIPVEAQGSYLECIQGHTHTSVQTPHLLLRSSLGHCCVPRLHSIRKHSPRCLHSTHVSELRTLYT